MATVYDIEANKLIWAVAKRLESNGEIKAPAFLKYSKSGPHVESAPQDAMFWYKRCASVLRQAYIRGKVGTGGLRVHYGGRKRHVVRSAHHMDSGGSLVRKALQSLEKAGYLKKDEKSGRVLTPNGRKFMDGVCKELRQ